MSPKPQKQFRPLPVMFTWEGDLMRPLPRFQALCDRQFVVGEEYPLSIIEERSQASHNHYFAAMHDAWLNLNEQDAKRFPEAEALRAWALVENGYCHESDYVCASPQEARHLAVALRRMSKYSVIKISGNVVKHFEPESQSVAAMKKQRFEASKADVLATVSAMARTTPAQLNKNAGRSA